ncbi:MAG: hypothetical protein ACKVQR_02580 [Aquabacterium sp.]
MQFPSFNRRAALAAVAGATVSVRAQAPRKWAVMSLIGRDLTVVGYQSSTGSRINQDQRSVRTMPPLVLDDPAMKQVSDLIRRRQPGAVVGTISASDAEYTQQDALVQDGRYRAAADLAADFKREGYTHLFLLTRHRAAAQLRMFNKYQGTGNLEGAGFYIDTEMPIRNLNNGIVSIGYLAPFVYFQLHLVDLASGTVVLQRELLTNDVVTNEKGERNFHPANALNPAQRIQALRDLVSAALDAAVPDMLQRLGD